MAATRTAYGSEQLPQPGRPRKDKSPAAAPACRGACIASLRPLRKNGPPAPPQPFVTIEYREQQRSESLVLGMVDQLR